MAARALLSGVLEPSRLASTFLMPASSSTVRIEPPAITPVPGAAGRINTLAAPSRPLLRVGIELVRVEPAALQLAEASGDAPFAGSFGLLLQLPGASGGLWDPAELIAAARAAGVMVTAAVDPLAQVLLALLGVLGFVVLSVRWG